MSTNARNHTRKHAKGGVSKAKPVQMRLLPVERAEFDDLCLSLKASESYVSRQIYLKGLAVLRSERATT